MTGAETVLKWCKDFAKQNGGQSPSPYEIRCQLEMAIDFEQDYNPETPQGKYSPEQIAFLEEHAKAAMIGMMANSIDVNQGMQPFWNMDFAVVSKHAYDLAEAMLQERTKRLEK